MARHVSFEAEFVHETPDAVRIKYEQRKIWLPKAAVRLKGIEGQPAPDWGSFDEDDPIVFSISEDLAAEKEME